MASGMFGAISLIGDATGASVTSNQIRGNGELGINLLFDNWADTAPSDNTFVGNNIATFEATTVGAYLDAGSEATLSLGTAEPSSTSESTTP